MSFSAAELNYLILRYLEESGLTHTAFLLARESQMDLHEVGNREVPSGALVQVVQKGLSFVEFESKAGLEGGESSDVPRMGLLDAVTDEAARHRGRERLSTNDMPGTSGQTQRDRDRDARSDRSMGGPGGASNGGGGGGGPNHATPKRDRSVHQQPGLSPTNSVSSQSGTGPGRGGTNQHPGGGGGGANNSTPNGQYNKKQAAMNGLNRDLHGKSAADVLSQKVASVL